MNTLARCTSATLLILLTACSSVFVSEPVGETAEPLEPADWQGTWVSGEVVLMTTVLDAESGRLQAAWLERYEEGARLERYEGEVRRSGDWLFISMPRNPEENAAEAGEPPTAKPPVYLWARLANDGRSATVWWPDVESFRAAVADGTLTGSLDENDDVHLAPLGHEDLARISDPGTGFLNWQEPTVFVRIGD